MKTKKNKDKEKRKKKEHMTLWEYLKEYRTPQRCLSERTGLSTTAINSIIKKKNLPTLISAMLIEQATNGVVGLYNWEVDLAEYKKSNISEDEK